MRIVAGITEESGTAPGAPATSQHVRCRNGRPTASTLGDAAAGSGKWNRSDETRPQWISNIARPASVIDAYAMPVARRRCIDASGIENRLAQVAVAPVISDGRPGELITVQDLFRDGTSC